MDTQSILVKLREPFPPNAHKERKLPGGGRWFYIPWQTIRDRLEELFPLDWTATYSDPVVVGDYTVIRCQLTILRSQGGITREGVGNDKAYPELNDQGKAKTIGTPPERARADAFKAAAEEFGIGSYLDDQQFVIRHMQGKGDGRAAKFALENGWLGNEPSSSVPLGAVGREKLLNDIDREIKRLQWTAKQGSSYLEQTYGKRRRQDLTNNQLSEFLGHLKAQPSPRAA